MKHVIASFSVDTDVEDDEDPVETAREVLREILGTLEPDFLEVTDDDETGIEYGPAEED